MNYLERITANPEICFGKPCIKGTRIWVSLILDNLAENLTFEEIIEEYPSISKDDILAAISYGADSVRERFVDLSITK